jgi:NDP-sugar pyrophosphorylase family protein
VSRRAVILAGGRGSRLAPYTTVLPKPLLPVGDRAILDVVVRQLHRTGFDDLTIAVGHLAHLIAAVFGDGSGHGVRIAYHEERTPRGTAGPLASIEGLDETFLMLNGDVLTTLDFRALLDAHRAAGNALTIATHRREVFIDYGVLHTDGANRLVAYEEKPTLPYTVSMGVYALEPSVRAHVPADRPFDLPDLVNALLAAGEPVGSYPYDGYWLDIGRHDDYEQAIVEFDGLLPRLLPGDAS